MNNQKNILVVEDEDSLRDALVEKFKSAGYEVRQAGDGKVGLTLAKKHHPDVILLDIMMPVMDGISMLKELKETDNDSRIIILTNRSDLELVNKALSEGASDYIIKSDFDLQEILETVEG